MLVAVTLVYPIFAVVLSLSTFLFCIVIGIYPRRSLVRFLALRFHNPELHRPFVWICRVVGVIYLGFADGRRQ
ncbi:hypothetical protein DFP72DRAFT_592027 [Ephemerocybe angulata]|uniref:Uncharacterized protein n=1 Tax=Ephemerocybe angulata TaxID=980116 RepID=A0A8H6MEB4_9AGAR|nr:hypothetical protein DFP72DRAFT_592027 [Tulosesus angulatus]